jgi:adenine-specific DNA methylase
MSISDSVLSDPSLKEISNPVSAKTLGDLCFIETQFPVSKMSMESYAERKANYSQTLTGLGKWWGRKPLVLCRAAILGLLLPATHSPKKDREVFLRLMTMDDDGMLRRKSVNMRANELFLRSPPANRARCFEPGSNDQKAKIRRDLLPEDRENLQKQVFLSLSYDERMHYCDRPEQIEGPSPQSWEVINAHLGTSAHSLPELVSELGIRRFGHVPRIGDAFCGGGSLPFEAARLGCDTYGSDLNPVAALLTWASLNIAGGGTQLAQRIRASQEEVYAAVDRQITKWGIEHNEKGWRADAYLYCHETRCPECGWLVPLAPSWIIGEKTCCVAKLKPEYDNKRFEINIDAGVSAAEMAVAKGAGTVKNSALQCPHCQQTTPIRAIRRDREGVYGLRPWTSADLVPRPEDIFQERLYCIRWVESYKNKAGKTIKRRQYAAPTKQDIKREAKILELLSERFDEWQSKSFIPNRKIESGYNTDQPIRERGWTYWHHLFNPRPTTSEWSV